jgi:hypothetical protein
MSTPNPPCLTPDQDGYRTPTIEDVEAFARQRPRFRQPQDESSYFPSAAALQSILQDRNKSIVGQDKKAGHVEEEIPKSLTWKQRLRHFTWSFFTLSMATGGIANVIYSSMLFLTSVESYNANSRKFLSGSVDCMLLDVFFSLGTSSYSSPSLLLLRQDSSCIQIHFEAPSSILPRAFSSVPVSSALGPF